MIKITKFISKTMPKILTKKRKVIFCKKQEEAAFFETASSYMTITLTAFLIFYTRIKSFVP